jgi:phosphodiesterase/alkaline phosphatase D-like protein
VHCGTNLDQVVSGMARKYMADRLRRGVADGPVDTTDVLQWTKAHWRPRGETD